MLTFFTHFVPFLTCRLHSMESINILIFLYLQLSECKSKDKNVTLLKFLVSQIYKNEPDLMDFVDDLIPLTLVPEGLYNLSLIQFDLHVEILM